MTQRALLIEFPAKKHCWHFQTTIKMSGLFWQHNPAWQKPKKRGRTLTTSTRDLTWLNN